MEGFDRYVDDATLDDTQGMELIFLIRSVFAISDKHCFQNLTVPIDYPDNITHAQSKRFIWVAHTGGPKACS